MMVNFDKFFEYWFNGEVLKPIVIFLLGYFLGKL